MKAFLIDVINDSTREIDTEGKLDDLYDLIGCRCIDIVVREINGVPYNVVLDDEGLLVEHPIKSAVYPSMTPALFGNLVLFGLDKETCDLSPITDTDVKNIRRNVEEEIDLRARCMHPVLVIDSVV